MCFKCYAMERGGVETNNWNMFGLRKTLALKSSEMAQWEVVIASQA